MAVALYLHVPFCKSICFYCDFKRGLYNENMADTWLLQIEKELISKSIQPNLKTLYIGGGTPTSLNSIQLERLLKLLVPYTKQLKEYTIESNIESLNQEKLSLLKKYGVNRISLGVQSLQDSLLSEMNRKHRKKDVLTKIDEIYGMGITNISVDLIYGFDTQTLEMWREDLLEIVKNEKISHISLYSLTIEENSVFGKQGRQNCENELEAQMYETAMELLNKYGYTQYEVANFAKNEAMSKHNLTYWEYDDFYGIGVGASGKEGNVRYELSGGLKAYCDGNVEINKEVLSISDQMFENIMMSLRMKKGLDLEKFKQRYKIDIFSIYDDIIQEEIKNGMLWIDENHLKTTKKGMFYLHDVLVKFLR